MKQRLSWTSQRWLLLGLALLLPLWSCTNSSKEGRFSGKVKQPQERRYNLAVGQTIRVKLNPNDALVYRFEVQISGEGLYRFETIGDSDTLCALVKPEKNRERFLVVSETGGEGDNCRMIWAFAKGRYVFKVRADGEVDFRARIQQISWGKLNRKKLQASGQQVGVLKNKTQRDRFTFELRSRRLVQFRVAGKGLLQCILRDGNGNWMSIPGFRQPYGSCTVAQTLKAGRYYFEVRSNEKKALYKLFYQQIRLQTMENNSIRKGFLQPLVSDIYKVYLKKGHQHELRTHGGRSLRCGLEDEIGHKVPSSKVFYKGNNCQLTGQFKEGWYYFRVRLRSKSSTSGEYLVSLRQQAYEDLNTNTKRKIVPDFSKATLLYRLQVKDAQLYQISVSGRPIRCHLKAAKGQKVSMMNLSDSKHCLMFANLGKGDYYLHLSPQTRDESPFELKISRYKSPGNKILELKIPRLVGPVSQGYSTTYEFTLKQPQLVNLETRGKLDTKCALLDSAKQKLATDDDAGIRYNCQLTRYLKAGKYYLRVSVGGSREGIFWVQRMTRKMPWLKPGKSFSGTLRQRNKPQTVLLKLKKDGMYSIGTSGGVDTICKLLNNQWKKIARDDDSGVGKNCLITRVLQAGVYPIEVRLYRNPGRFTLRLRRIKSKKLALNKQISVLMSRYERHTYLEVNIPRRSLYVLQTFGGTDTICELLNNQGKRIARNDDSGIGKNCRLVENLSQGRYFLKITLYRRRYRRYYTLNRFKVGLTEKKLKTTQLEIGKPLTGVLVPGRINQYKILLKSRGYYKFETTGSTDPKCYLLDAGKRQIAMNDDGGYNRNCRIARRMLPGTYYLQIRPAYSRGRGTYKLYLTK
jgi:CTP-dependent riboflavin kinase